MRRVYQILHNVKYRLKRLKNIVHTKVRLTGNGVQYKGYRIVGLPYISVSGGGRIVLGDGLEMNNGMLGNPNPCVLRAEDGGSILIGKHVGMSQTTLVAKGADITIGNNVKLGGGVKIYTTDFHCMDFLKRRNTKLDMTERRYDSVIIGDDCFIGAGVIILKGVTIGARCVV